jgi:hypothetical protein
VARKAFYGSTADAGRNKEITWALTVLRRRRVDTVIDERLKLTIAAGLSTVLRQPWENSPRIPGHDEGTLDRRLKLKPDEKSLLQKLQRGTWTLAELEWLERHLRPDTPTVLVAELRHRLQALRQTLTQRGEQRDA